MVRVAIGSAIHHFSLFHSRPVAIDIASPACKELPPPRKLLLKHPGWGSDDTKTFEKDRGGEHTHTHTHTHCSLFSKVASFLL